MCDRGVERQGFRLGYGLSLLAIFGQACVQLPALSLGVSSHLRTRMNGSVAASAFAVGATLGWRARLTAGTGTTEPGPDDLAASASAPAGCAFASLCLWEQLARSQALMRIATDTEDPP